MRMFSLLAGIIMSHNLAAKDVDLSLDINVDKTLALKVLQTVCSNQSVDRAFFSQSEDILDMLKHFSQFRSYFTLENYLVELETASRCQQSQTNYFRFNQLVEQKQAIVKELENINEQMGAQIANLLGPFAPKGINGSYQAFVMVGTPSCGGWSSQRRFYIDLPCIQNDPQGLKHLIAHETYHLIQSDIMPRAFESHYVARFLEEMVKEGSAMFVTDITQIDNPGDYTQKSLESVAKNRRRSELNLALFELLLTKLAVQPEDATWQRVYNIGFSGSYDAPMYSVGEHMVGSVIEKYGNAQYVEWLQTQPLTIVRKYAELTEQPWLLDTVTGILNGK